MSATFVSRILLKGEDRTKGAFGSVKRGIGGIGKAVLGLTGILGAGGFVLAGKQAIDAADRIGKLSKATGTSTEFLSQMGHAVKLTGGEFETFSKGMFQLERNVVQANEGMKQYQRAFERVGISTEELKGLNPEQIFARVADAVASIEDPSIKTATAMDIFGRSGKELIPLLNEGSAGMAKMREQADALGLTLSKDQTAAAEAANDAITKFKGALQGATNTLILALAPALQAIGEWLATKLPLALNHAQKGFINLRKTVIDIVGTVVTGLEGMYTILGALPGSLGRTYRAAARDMREFSFDLGGFSAELRGEMQRLIKEGDELAEKLRLLVPDAGAAADAISEIDTSSIPAKKSVEGLALATEFLNEQERLSLELPEQRVKAMIELQNALNNATEATDEETAALKRQEEQARKTAAAFNQLFNAVGSLNQTFGLGLSPLQGEGVAQALQNLGVDPGILGTFAAGAQGGGTTGGQILGGLGAVGGAAFGPIGSAIGSFIGQAIGDAIFGPNGPRDSEILFGSANISGRGNQDPQDTRLRNTFVDGLIRDSNQAFADEFLGPAVQMTEGFFDALELALSPEQLTRAVGALEGRTFMIRPEDVEGGRFLEPILDTIIGAMDPAVQRFVSQFEGIESRLEAFAAINLTLAAIQADPLEQWAEALADADRTAIQVLRDMAQETANLGRTAFDSVEDMVAFGASVEAFNRQFIQMMAGIEQAGRNISASTESTIQGLRFTALEGNPNAQFEFLTRRANQLGAGIGGLGSASEVERTVAMIQQLLTQAFGIATPEQRQSLLPLFEDTIRSAEEEAQARLDELREEAEAIAQERREQNDALIQSMSDSSSAIIDAADRFGIGGDRVIQAAEKIESGGNAILAGARVLAEFPTLRDSGFEVTG